MGLCFILKFYWFKVFSLSLSIFDKIQFLPCIFVVYHSFCLDVQIYWHEILPGDLLKSPHGSIICIALLISTLEFFFSFWIQSFLLYQCFSKEITSDFITNICLQLLFH